MSRTILFVSKRFLRKTHSHEFDSKKRIFPILKLDGLEETRTMVKTKKPNRPFVGRYKQMDINQDWTTIWPAPRSFSFSTVPLPIYQGYAKNSAENKGVSPGKYANTELMKIPNFLHLTPTHIKKYCVPLKKKYCTEWPAELATEEDIQKHLPMTIITRDYLNSSNTIRDPRARKVELLVPLDVLQFDHRAKEKFLNLIGKEKFDEAKQMVHFSSDRCPVKKQNYDYLMFVLQVVCEESRKMEVWEEAIDESSWLTYKWHKSQSKENVDHVVQQIQPSKPVSETVVSNYGESVSRIMDKGESLAALENYGQNVLKLYNIE